MQNAKGKMQIAKCCKMMQNRLSLAVPTLHFEICTLHIAQRVQKFAQACRVLQSTITYPCIPNGS